jgi:hypothetical protein
MGQSVAAIQKARRRVNRVRGGTRRLVLHSLSGGSDEETFPSTAESCRRRGLQSGGLEVKK